MSGFGGETLGAALPRLLWTAGGGSAASSGSGGPITRVYRGLLRVRCRNAAACTDSVDASRLWKAASRASVQRHDLGRIERTTVNAHVVDRPGVVALVVADRTEIQLGHRRSL